MGKDRSKFICRKSNEKRKRKKDLHQQFYERLTSMIAFGESKKEAKKNEEGIKEKIYSKATYDTYKKQIRYFEKWLKKEHPEVQDLEEAREYVSEWLVTRALSIDKNGKGLSAWTLNLEAAALNKLFGISKDDPDRYTPPERRRVDIKRSRGAVEYDRHFSERTHEELVNFCKGTGCRRGILERLRGKDLLTQAEVKLKLAEAEKKCDIKMARACKEAVDYFPDREFFLIHEGDKGGKTRIAPIIGDHVSAIVERMRHTAADDLVWQHVPKACDVHGYRAQYATALYKEIARPLNELRYERKVKCADGKFRSEIYVCRADEVGKRLDRKAVAVVSRALGHSREDTAITNYIRNI